MPGQTWRRRSLKPTQCSLAANFFFVLTNDQTPLTRARQGVENVIARLAVPAEPRKKRSRGRECDALGKQIFQVARRGYRPVRVNVRAAPATWPPKAAGGTKRSFGPLHVIDEPLKPRIADRADHHDSNFFGVKEFHRQVGRPHSAHSQAGIPTGYP